VRPAPGRVVPAAPEREGLDEVENGSAPKPSGASAQRRDAAPLLEVRDLSVSFATRRGEVRAVEGVTFEIGRSTMLGLAGESGSGKSVTARAIIGLHPPRTSTISGSIRFCGKELVGIRESQWQAYRGSEIAMVYQDAMRSLNPTMTVGAQIAEAIRHHMKVDRAESKARTIELFRKVRLPLPERRYSS
jgi:peptide/nickel transport system ATP-binding protein